MSVRAAALFAALSASIASAGVASVPLVQDDAGSGADAPGTFRVGVPIVTGITYTGTLQIARPLGPRVPFLGLVVDDEDWYRVFLHKGRMVTVTGEALGRRASTGSVDVVKFELRRPDSKIAGFVTASSDRPGSREVPADVSGWWALRVYAENDASPADVSIPYGFVVTEQEPAMFASAHSGSGYLALGVTLDPQATLAGQVWFSHATENGAPGRRDVFMIGPGGTDGVLSHPSRLGPTSVGTRWGRVTARIEVEDLGGGQLWGTIDARGPGTFFVIAIVDAADIYTFVRDVAVTAGGRILGVSTAGSSSVYALTPADFRSTATVSTEVAEASIQGAATIEVRHVFVGSYFCTWTVGVADCSYRRPDGTDTRFSAGFVVIAPGQPGSWTFRRDYVAGDSFGYPLFGADVRLPGTAA